MYAGPLVFCLGFFTGIFLIDFFNLLFTFDREDVFFPLLTNAFGATFLLTAFFFGCFFGLDFFLITAFLFIAISLHPLLIISIQLLVQQYQ